MSITNNDKSEPRLYNPEGMMCKRTISDWFWWHFVIRRNESHPRLNARCKKVLKGGRAFYELETRRVERARRRAHLLGMSTWGNAKSKARAKMVEEMVLRGALGFGAGFLVAKALLPDTIKPFSFALGCAIGGSLKPLLDICFSRFSR